MTNSRTESPSPKQWIKISHCTVNRCHVTEVWHSKLGQNDLHSFLNSVSLPIEVQAAHCLRQCYQSNLTEQLRVKSAGRNPKSGPSLGGQPTLSAKHCDKGKRLCSRSTPRSTSTCTTSTGFMRKNSKRHQNSFAPSAVSILSFDDEHTPCLLYRNNTTLPTISPSKKEPVGIGRVRKLQELLQGKEEGEEEFISTPTLKKSSSFGLGPDSSPCATPDMLSGTKRGKSASCSSSKIPTLPVQRPVSVPAEKTRKFLEKIQNEQVIMIPFNGRGDSARTWKSKSASTDVSVRSSRSIYSAMSKCTSYCIETINPSDLKAYLRADSSQSEPEQTPTPALANPSPPRNDKLTCVGKPFSLHKHQEKFYREPVIPIALCVLRRLQQQNAAVQSERNSPAQ